MGEDEFAGPAYVSAGGSPSDHPDGHGIVASQDARPLAPAGLSLPVILITPLELRGGSATVIVRCEKASPLPAGTRLVGTATSSDGRVSMRFRSVLLADGRSAEIDGEAQDEDGSFGLRAGVVAAEDGAGDRGGLSLGHIARDTAMDALASTLGPGIAGRAADRTVRGALGPMERQPARGPRPAVTLEAGTRLQVFLHSAIQPGR